MQNFTSNTILAEVNTYVVHCHSYSKQTEGNGPVDALELHWLERKFDFVMISVMLHRPTLT